MIRGYERAGFEDFKALKSSLQDPQAISTTLSELSLPETTKLSILRD